MKKRFLSILMTALCLLTVVFCFSSCKNDDDSASKAGTITDASDISYSKAKDIAIGQKKRFEKNYLYAKTGIDINKIEVNIPPVQVKLLEETEYYYHIEVSGAYAMIEGRMYDCSSPSGDYYIDKKTGNVIKSSKAKEMMSNNTNTNNTSSTVE